MKRQQFIEEQLLREYIRKAIRIAFRREHDLLLEERKLRSTIRKLILEVEIPEEVPHRSTGINVLEELLKKIIPILEDAYKSLTSNSEQRKSFRAHIIQAVQNALVPSKVFRQAAADMEKLEEQEIEIDVGEKEDPAAFIDVDRPGKKQEKHTPEEKQDDFTIAGEDLTGRNVALKTFETVERNIVDSYDVLSDEEDRQLFYDYLLTNLKLYFDKFEDELETTIPEEPTTTEYEAEVDAEEEEEYIDFEEEL